MMNRIFTRAVALRDELTDLNGQGVGSAALVVDGALWFAFATDPDGEWFFESGDPAERIDPGTGLYAPVTWDFLGPVIDVHGATLVVPAPDDVVRTKEQTQ